MTVSELSEHFKVNRNVIKHVIQYRNIETKKDSKNLYLVASVEGYLWQYTRPELIKLKLAKSMMGFINETFLIMCVLSSGFKIEFDSAGVGYMEKKLMGRVIFEANKLEKGRKKMRLKNG